MKVLSLFVFLFLLALPGLASAGKALLIVDMQEVFFYGTRENPEGYKTLQTLIQKQKRVIDLAKAKNIPIVFAEWRGAGNTLVEIRMQVADYAQKMTFIKRTDGLFEEGTVGDAVTLFLQRAAVTELIVMGINGDACVQKTIEGALDKGFKITTYPQGIANINRAPIVTPYFFSPKIWISYRIRQVQKAEEAFD